MGIHIKRAIKYSMSNKLILIIEDEPAISEVIEFALNQENFKTQSCATGAAALNIIEREIFNLLIIDLGLPDTNGFELARVIKQKHDLPFIFLTSRSEEIDKILGFEIGADDYITKPFSPRELTARVKAIIKRFSTAEKDSKITRFRDFTINEDKLSVTFKDQELSLTRYEYKILLLLVSNPGKVFTRDNIMNSIWEDPNMSLDRTIDTHIKTLRFKIKAIDSTNDVIITHRGTGYSIKENQ